MKSTFRILFYGRANAVSQDGTIPLTARVSINGEHVAHTPSQSVVGIYTKRGHLVADLRVN